MSTPRALIIVLLSVLVAAASVEHPVKAKLNTATPVTIPSIFYTRNFGINTQEINYYKVVLCEEQPASGYITVLINVPNNPIMNMTAHGWPAVELGYSATGFTSSTVFTTNYIWGQTALSTIVVAYDVTNFMADTFYIRVTAEVFSTNYNLQVLFSSTGTPTPWHYDSRAFPTQVVQGPFSFLEQYGTTGTSPLSVNNLDVSYFFVQFCDLDIASGSYSVTITATANPAKPRSAFNLYACAATSIPLSACNEYNNNGQDQNTAIVVTVQLQNSVTPLGDGIYILVEGFGGELDSKNSFFLQAKLESP